MSSGFCGAEPMSKPLRENVEERIEGEVDGELGMVVEPVPLLPVG